MGRLPWLAVLLMGVCLGWAAAWHLRRLPSAPEPTPAAAPAVAAAVPKAAAVNPYAALDDDSFARVFQALRPARPARRAAEALAVRSPQLEARPADEPPPPQEQSSCRIYGLVYDLMTDKPVAGASVIVTGGPMPLGARTDAAGHYALDVGKWGLGRFMIEVAAPGYRPGALEESDPPYRARSARDRRRLAHAISNAALGAILLSGTKDVLNYDFVLVPMERLR